MQCFFVATIAALSICLVKEAFNACFAIRVRSKRKNVANVATTNFGQFYFFIPAVSAVTVKVSLLSFERQQAKMAV